MGTEYRVANQTHRRSEHSFSNEPQNSTTSKRKYYYHWSQTLVKCQIQVLSLIPLVILGNPLISIHLKLGEVGEISLKQNTNLRRGGDIDCLLLPLLLGLTLLLLIGEVRDQRRPNTHIREEEDVPCHQLPPLQFIL